jgi:cytochrome c oxidase subunit IV
MTERNLYFIATVAAAVTGLADFIRESGGLSTLMSAVLIVVVVAGVVVTVVAVMAWARIRQRGMKSSSR